MGWIRSDERQFCNEEDDRVFMIVEVVKHPSAGYTVSKTCVDLNKYGEDEIQGIVSMYGYTYENGRLGQEKSDEELIDEDIERECYLPSSNNNGFIWAFQWQIIAECIAETVGLRDAVPCNEFEQAKQMVIQFGVPQEMVKQMCDVSA